MDTKAFLSTMPTDFQQVLDDAEQSLAQMTLRLPMELRFRWHDIAFRARVGERSGMAQLRLVGDLGPVPYSAESGPGRARLMSLATWRHAPGDYRFIIDQRQHLNLIGEGAIRQPVRGGGVVATTAALLLRARPYIALAREQQAGDAAIRSVA